MGKEWIKFKKEHGIHDYTEIIFCEKSILNFINKVLGEQQKINNQVLADKCDELDIISKNTKSQCANELEVLWMNRTGVSFYDKKEIMKLQKKWRGNKRKT